MCYSKLSKHQFGYLFVFQSSSPITPTGQLTTDPRWAFHWSKLLTYTFLSRTLKEIKLLVLPRLMAGKSNSTILLLVKNCRWCTFKLGRKIVVCFSWRVCDSNKGRDEGDGCFWRRLLEEMSPSLRAVVRTGKNRSLCRPRLAERGEQTQCLTSWREVVFQKIQMWLQDGSINQEIFNDVVDEKIYFKAFLPYHSL